MLDKGFFPVGTVMKSSSDLPVVFAATKLKPREIVCRRKGQLLAMKWRDKRNVFVLGNKEKQ